MLLRRFGLRMRGIRILMLRRIGIGGIKKWLGLRWKGGGSVLGLEGLKLGGLMSLR